MQGPAQRGAATELARELHRAHAPGRSRALHTRLQRRDSHAQDERRAQHALAADQANLQVGPLGDRDHQRNEATGRKVDVPNAAVGLVQDIAELELHRLAGGEQAL